VKKLKCIYYFYVYLLRLAKVSVRCTGKEKLNTLLLYTTIDKGGHIFSYL
jgi:hypothetical protein